MKMRFGDRITLWSPRVTYRRWKAYRAHLKAMGLWSTEAVGLRAFVTDVFHDGTPEIQSVDTARREVVIRCRNMHAVDKVGDAYPEAGRLKGFRECFETTLRFQGVKELRVEAPASERANFWYHSSELLPSATPGNLKLAIFVWADSEGVRSHIVIDFRRIEMEDIRPRIMALTGIKRITPGLIIPTVGVMERDVAEWGRLARHAAR